MHRLLGTLLLILGLLLGLVGFIGTILAIKDLQKGGAGLLVAFLIVDFVGASLVLTGVLVLRRSRVAAAIPPATDTEISYTPNRPTQREMDGSQYEVLYTPPVRGKHPRPSTLRVSTAVSTTGEFHMAPETGFDRYFTRLGLARELLTGDEVFDTECYIRSDRPNFTAAYLTDPVKRVAILDLRRLGFPEVVLKAGLISAVWTGFDPLKNDRPELTEEAAARLILLSRNLPEHLPEFDQRVGRHRTQWQVLSWIFLAVFGLSLLSLIPFPPVVGLDLLAPSLGVLILVLPAFALISGWLVSGTSTSHYVWRSLILAALFVIPVGSPGIITFVNGAFDRSGPTVHRAVIVDKHTTRSKNKTRYHVSCESWRDPGEQISFEVAGEEYQRAVPNQSELWCTTREGRLGIEWVQSKQVEARRAGG